MADGRGGLGVGTPREEREYLSVVLTCGNGEMAKLQMNVRSNWPFSSGISQPATFKDSGGCFWWCFFSCSPRKLGGSWNGGTLLWMVYSGKSDKMDDLGILPFWETSRWKSGVLSSSQKMSKKCWLQHFSRLCFGMCPTASDHSPVAACKDEHPGSVLDGLSEICWDFVPHREFQGKPPTEDPIIILGHFLGYQQPKQTSMKQSIYWWRKTSCTNW